MVKWHIEQILKRLPLLGDIFHSFPNLAKKKLGDGGSAEARAPPFHGYAADF